MEEMWFGMDSIHVDDYQHDINDNMMINIVSFTCWSNIYEGTVMTYKEFMFQSTTTKQ